MEGIDALPLDPLPSAGDDVLELVVVTGAVARRIGLLEETVELSHRIRVKALEKRIDVAVNHSAISIDAHEDARAALVAPENGRLPRALNAREKNQGA